jgi:NADH pyrophosphatase NudC (nudix superfamily)
MQGTTFLFLFALLLIVIWFVTRPFGREHKSRFLVNDHQISSLLAERERVLQALEELDFDYALGKIPADEYDPQRSALLKQGAALLRQLDALSSLTEQKTSNGARQPDLMNQRATITDDEIETLIAARRTARKARSGGFCSACGKPILASDRFCPHCGKTIR